MKKIFLAFAILAVNAIAVDRLDAQPAMGTTLIQNSTAYTDNGSALPYVNARAAKDFKKTFNHITDETWFNTTDGGHIASFISDFVQTVVAYNPNGFRQYIIRYYGESKLSDNIKASVKSTYRDYIIMGVSELNFDNRTAYLVYLQNNSNQKSILVIEDDIKEMQSFKR